MKRTAHSPAQPPWMLALLGLALLAGCSSRPAPQAATATVTGVRIETVRLGQWPDEVEAPGTVESVATAPLIARTMGTITRVEVREGDLVKAGQLLVQIDDHELSAHRSAAQSALEAASAGREEASRGVSAAQAQADVAQKTYERFVFLRDQRSVSPQEFDEVEARQRAALASLEQARARRQQADAAYARAESEFQAASAVAGYTRVLAPFAGVVVRRQVDPGAVVMPGAPLLVVEDASRYRLAAAVDSQDAGPIRRGSPARVRLDSLPGREFNGTVAEIEAGADPSSHTQRVKVDLPHDPAIRSGLFGRAWFHRGSRTAIAIPRTAVIERGQIRGVYALDHDQLARLRVITLGQSAGEQVEVLSGLSEGDRILMDAAGRELDGKKVESR